MEKNTIEGTIKRVIERTNKNRDEHNKHTQQPLPLLDYQTLVQKIGEEVGEEHICEQWLENFGLNPKKVAYCPILQRTYIPGIEEFIPAPFGERMPHQESVSGLLLEGRIDDLTRQRVQELNKNREGRELGKHSIQQMIVYARHIRNNARSVAL